MEVNTFQLLKAIAATGAGTSYVPIRRAPFNPNSSGVFQVNITGTATVNIEGNCDTTETAPWVVITTLTATGGVAVTLMPHMRANVTSYSSGTVDAWLSNL